MKFKVGDKVKRKATGEIFKIKRIDRGGAFLPYLAKNKNGDEHWFTEEELEIAEYTYEDLKKAPIGTKVIFESGEILIKDGEDYYENYDFYRRSNDLKGLKDNGNNGKIIKIEEPKYETVYEYKPEILDEVEKRYLRGVIRPFRNEVKFIEKSIYSDRDARIRIKTKTDDGYWYFGLPPFKKDTMYKNMEDDKEYTLEELGL